MSPSKYPPIVASLIAFAFISNTASADPIVVKQMFHVLVGQSPLEDKTLTSTDDSHVRLRMADGGTKIGAGARTTLVYHRMRGSFGFGAFGIRGAEMGIEPRQEVGSARSAGAYFELTAGYEFRLGPLFPYTDLRAHIGFANLSLALPTEYCGEQYLPIEATKYYGIGPSAGVFIPVIGYFFVDVSGHGSIVGERSFGAFGGMGVWFPSE